MPHLLVLGDSILWGQGLEERYKPTRLLADAWASAASAAVTISRFAHSGAMIWREDPPHGANGCPPELMSAPPPFAATLPVGDDEVRATLGCGAPDDRDRDGEIPRSEPYILRQILDARRELTTDPDLVLVDCGINDTRLYNLVLPGKDTAAVVARARSLRPFMRFALRSVTDAFENARVIVTGYYPVVAGGSRHRKLYHFGVDVLRAAGQVVADSIANALHPDHIIAVSQHDTIVRIPTYNPVKHYFDELVERNASWVTAIHDTIHSVIGELGLGGRIGLAIPRFGDDEVLFGRDTLLWGGTDDQVRDERDRIAATSTELTPYDRLVTRVASVGHPNVRGAKRYAEAVIRAAGDLEVF